MVNAFVLPFLFLILSSCAPFVDSPFSDQLLNSDRDLNMESMVRMKDIESDGVIKMAVFADPHQNYKALDKIFFEINTFADVDFVVGLGDYTNSGYNLEYDQFLDGLKYLTHPKLMVLGNHDAIGAGPELFEKAFGQANFIYESATYRFVFFNGNNWEDPDDFRPDWLKERVEESTKSVIVFSHTPLLDEERYNGAAADTLRAVVQNTKVKLALNGHNHVYKLGSDSGTILLQGPRAEGSQWLLVELQGNQVCIQRMNTKESECRSLK